MSYIHAVRGFLQILYGLWKEVVDKDINDLHIKPRWWYESYRGKWLEGIGVTEAMSVMTRAEYECVYVSGAGSPSLTWI